MTTTHGRVLSLTGVSLACFAVACSSQTPGGKGGTPSTGGAAGAATAGSSGGGVPSGGAGGSGAGAGVATGGAGIGAGGSAGEVGGAGNTGGAGPAGASGLAGLGGAGAGGGMAGSGGMAGGGMAGSGGMAGGAGTGPTTCPFTPPTLPGTFPANWASGTVITFNDDGAWTWYSDERVVVDAAGGKIIVSSDANGGSRNGNVDVVIHDVATGQNSRFVLGDLGPDDHNNAAILVKSSGQYLAFWAGHNENCNTYWRHYSGTQWAAQQIFNWGQHSAPCPWTSSMRSVTYNNVFKMSAEGKLYNFTRTVDTSPNFLVSSDNGQTWTYGGRLTSTPQVGYVAGYYKYWGNDVDRIDFLATEAHPRDNNNSLYHGYIKGGQVYDSLDRVVDANVNDANAREIVNYTRVFQTGTQLQGMTLNYLWNFDVVRYADGTIGALWKARNNGTQGQANPDHRILYSRFNGTTWTSTYLVKGGEKLYDSEQDYVGGAALDPDDPHVIYVSTPFDPRNDTTDLGQHEIWKGVTCDNGASFTWTPVTMNSDVDNLRPVVPKWDARNTALLWFRGTYQTAQIYDEEVVGIVTRR